MNNEPTNKELVDKVIVEVKQIIAFACKDGITDFYLKGWVGEIVSTIQQAVAEQTKGEIKSIMEDSPDLRSLEKNIADWLGATSGKDTGSKGRCGFPTRIL